MNPRMMTGLAVVTAALLAAACGSDDPGGVTDGAATMTISDADGESLLVFTAKE